MTSLQPCGTRAAYVRHRKNGEHPCGPCTDANRAASRHSSAVTRARRVNTRPDHDTAPRKPRPDSMNAAWQWEPAATIHPHDAKRAAATVARHAPARDVPAILAALGIEDAA